MIGIDIVRIGRMRRIQNDKALLAYYFSESEILYAFLEPSCSLARFAGRFAAKEALFKACNAAQLDVPHLRTFIKEVSIISSKNGPVLEHTPTCLRESIYTPVISISHDGEYAIATALLCRMS